MKSQMVFIRGPGQIGKTIRKGGGSLQGRYHYYHIHPFSPNL